MFTWINVKKIGLGFLCATVLWISACTPRTDPPQQLDYRDWVEGAAGMYIESLATPNAKLYNLGETSLPGVFQYAIKFGSDAEKEDSGLKNAVLIECGMHGREWFAAESCYWFVDHLVRNRDTREIRALWDAVDIWILPQSNPAGREIDDLRDGDPTQYLHVCKGGSNEGDACTNDSECNSSDCYGAGWRTNANTAHCTVGVDLARNFSSGWTAAAGLCNASEFMKFRGPHPFSELETLNLRRFIHNHMVSTVLIVHANSQETWNRWASRSTANDHMVNQLISLNSAGVGSDTEAGMPRSSVGGGYGQFSAWITERSDVTGELDVGTQRNISTFFFELPITPKTVYETQDYDGDDYQFAPNDGSNTMHPSSSVWYRLWSDSILPMFTDVIRQAGSPQCPFDDNFVRVTDHCEANDFGLVGMKIAKDIDEPGALGFDPNTREETLAEGVYSVVFAVQNFSSDSSRKTTNATVEIYKDVVGTRTLDNSPAPRISITLDPGARGVFTVEHAFAVDEAYRVEVTLDSDDFTRDNTKSMAFRVARRMMRARPFDERLVENLEIWPMKADASKWVFEGQLSLPAKASQEIMTADVEVVVFPRRATAVPRPLVWKAPVKLTSTAQQQTVSPEAIARLSQKTSPRLAELDLIPGEKRDRHALRLVVDDPLLAKALAEGGTVLMRLTVDDPNIVAFGFRQSKVEPYLKVDPKNAEEDVEDEP